MKLHLGLEFEGELPPTTRNELEQIIATLQAWQVHVPPGNAEFLVGATHDELTAERLVTNTDSIRWDLGTTGQAKAHVIGSPFGAGYMMGATGGLDGNDGPPGRDGTVGTVGATGATGAAGGAGVPVFPFDGEDGDQWGFPGPMGPAGSNGAAGSSAGLLAVTSYNPATSTTKTTTSTTGADIDATNLAVTFTVPASGEVLVRLTGIAIVSNSAAGYWWCLRDTGGNNIAGTLRTVYSVVTGMSGPSAAMYVTGLTPSASVTYRWGHGVSANSGSLRYGDDGTTGGHYGQAVMEVWEVP